MEGILLNAKKKQVSRMAPVFEAIGEEFISGLNWRITYPVLGGSAYRYSFEGSVDIWISGEALWKEIIRKPDIVWNWGLLQGFDKSVPKSAACVELIDLSEDRRLWKNPVSRKSGLAKIEIEAYDSSVTVVITQYKRVIGRLAKAFPDSGLLSEYNEKHRSTKKNRP